MASRNAVASRHIPHQHLRAPQEPHADLWWSETLLVCTDRPNGPRERLQFVQRLYERARDALPNGDVRRDDVEEEIAKNI